MSYENRYLMLMLLLQLRLNVLFFGRIFIAAFLVSLGNTVRCR
jgi:hypothetical protein